MATTNPIDTDVPPSAGSGVSATVAVVNHSGAGHTRVQAEAVHRGVAGVDGITALLVSVDEIESHWDDLDRADAIIFGTPT